MSIQFITVNIKHQLNYSVKFMRKTQKWILGSFLTIIIALSGGFASWFFFFRQQPLEYPRLPDLTLSYYSLEDDILILTITNVGNVSTPSVTAIVSINTTNPAGNILYNNFENPEFLDQNEDFIITINLLDFKEYLVSETNYLIAVQIDLSDNVDESSEDNNEFLISYYYEEAESYIPLTLFPPNTYSLNSTISTFSYALQFNTTQILIENSLTITNGTFNGYQVINSTIVTNTTISNEIESISITLHGDQNLTMRNIWDPKIIIALSENSSLSLYNCSIQEITIDGAHNLLLWNSTIQFLSSIGNLIDSFSLNIANHSRVETCIISSVIFFEIEYSTFQSLYFIPSTDFYSQSGTYLIFGEINHCLITNIFFYGLTNVDIYQTNITQLNIIGKSRVNLVECIINEEYVHLNALSILNNTRILDDLYYGIKVYSDIVNITDGIIEGTSYESNILLINADINDMHLQTVVVNNSGRVFITNTSCNLYLYDSSVAIINESSLVSKRIYGAYLQDSSKLIGINTSLTSVLCNDNSSLDLNEESNIMMLYANSTNDISIDNCTLDEVRWYSEPIGNHNALIVNSTLNILIAPPSSKVDIINCSITWLYDGIRFESGTNYLNRTGSQGPGVVLNYLNITSSTIINRICTYIDIIGNSTVIIEDLHESFIISVVSGNLFLDNCTIDSLTMWNISNTYLENCSSTESGGFIASLPGIICYGNSHLYVNDTVLPSNDFIILFNAAQLTITNSVIYGIFLMEESRAIISYSEIGMIRVTASSSEGYALTLSYCSTQYLLTFSWKAKANMMLFLFAI